MRAVPDSIPDKKSFRRANVKDGWAFSLSGREQKENGGSSKGEKYFGCGNYSLVEGLRRPERSEGRRSPSTKGHADAILNCEKNNWPNV
jgi:hypothetical protein